MNDEPETPRFSRRLIVHEAPTVVAQLESLAGQHGHSLAAEVRGAIRAHLAAQAERTPEPIVLERSGFDQEPTSSPYLSPIARASVDLFDLWPAGGNRHEADLAG